MSAITNGLSDSLSDAVLTMLVDWLLSPINRRKRAITSHGNTSPKRQRFEGDYVQASPSAGIAAQRN